MSSPADFDPRIDFLDVLVNALRKHEEALMSIVERFEAIFDRVPINPEVGETQDDWESDQFGLARKVVDLHLLRYYPKLVDMNDELLLLRRSLASKMEILFDVLRIIERGAKKPTHIMYRASLSWKTLQRILKSMVSQGLIREIHARGGRDKRMNRYYELTQKGENAVRYFNHVGILQKLDGIEAAYR